MAKNKTTVTGKNVNEFLNSVADERKREDSFHIVEILQEETGFEPKMWGTSIIGFGSYHYKYESGREGDAPLVGFSPRKNALTLYLSPDFDEREQLSIQLGKHKTGKACIYIDKLEDIDLDILKEMINRSIEDIKKKYPQ